GDGVEKNMPLMVIDSPALLVAQENLLDLLRARDAPKPPRALALAADAQKHGLDGSGEPHQEAKSSSLVAGGENSIEFARRRLILQGFSGNQLSELEQTRLARDTFTLFSPHQGVVQDRQ